MVFKALRSLKPINPLGKILGDKYSRNNNDESWNKGKGTNNRSKFKINKSFTLNGEDNGKVIKVTSKGVTFNIGGFSMHGEHADDYEQFYPWDEINNNPDWFVPD